MTINRIHHLDGCTMRPRGLPVNGRGILVGHVLAVELRSGDVVLVDSGIGRAARREPRRMLGAAFVHGFRPDLSESGSVFAQLVNLGLADHVRHIVLTHLDVDHAGGLSDFPRATVHVHTRELAAGSSVRGWNARMRYRTALWGHGPRFRSFSDGGDSWNGFDGAQVLEGLTDEVVAIPLPGHTQGHVAVAVRSGENWLVHAGDCYFHGSSVGRDRDDVRWGAELFETVMAVDRRKVAANHERLAELVGRTDRTFEVFSAHDPFEFDECRAPNGANER
ncbi:MBL fold metallo-hydrolase [Rhodococcus qingshengii]|uniref:MBL fold metallo-hydrolase n=1 Tax=Rhodococcus qingshengii TaxID=334542 RepID=UPI0035DABF49